MAYILNPLGLTPEHNIAVADMQKNPAKYGIGSQFDYAAESAKDMVNKASNPATATMSAIGNVVARPVYDFYDAAKEYGKKGYQGEFSFSPQGAVDFAKNLGAFGKEFLGQKPVTMMGGALKGGIESLGTSLGESIYDKFNPEETSIDPTGKNLFTEYYEDDPYAGIEGQTAFFNPLSLLTFGSKMLGPAHAYKTGGINELMKYKIRKEISKDVAKKGKKAAQKILEAKAAAKAKAEAEARKKQQQKTIAAKGTAQGSGGTFVHSRGAMKGYEKGAGGGKDAPSEHFYIARGGLAQRAPRYANGGLINFYRYGGFI